MNGTEHKGLYCFKNLLKAPAQHKKFLFVTILLVLFYTCTGNNVREKNFDYFVFSQRWLPSACIEYIEHHSSNVEHQCILPKNFDFWAIHGLWPTQNNHMGPFFCNKSMIFDINKLKLIETDLKLYWPNIEKGKGLASLWQHEWDKHGTCAAQLHSLDSEFKYFSTALRFFKMYKVQNVLEKNNFLPNLNKGLNVKNLFYVIKNAFGKLPQIHCINEVKTKRPYLSEIRICFNKNLELIDCGNINNKKAHSNQDLSNSLTNCPFNQEIVYPDVISPKLDKISLKNSMQMSFYDSLASILSMIRFLQWISI